VLGLDVEKLIADYRPASTTFTITLIGGEVLKFRMIEDYDELEAFKQDAAEFIKIATGPKCVGLGLEKPVSVARASVAFTISTLSVEPEITQRDALRISANAWLSNQIMSEIEANKFNHERIRMAQEVEEQKKGSEMTPTEGHSSSSPETPITSTLTTSPHESGQDFQN
jgi:hypothetical protein